MTAPKKGHALIISTNNQFLKLLDGIYKEIEYTPIIANTDVLGYSKFKNQEFSHVMIHITSQTRSYLRLIVQLKTAKPTVQIVVLSPRELVNDPSFPNIRTQCTVIDYDDPNLLSASIFKKALDASQTSATKSPEEMLQGKKVLLIDDEEMVRTLIKEFLEEYQCQVSEAGDGDAGVRLALTQKFDFIILDFLMPNMNGDKVLEIIRKKFSPKELPVLVASGQSDMDNIKKLTAAGINGYIVKPIELSNLITKIATALK